MDKIFNIYTVYLQVNPGPDTASCLSKVLDNKICYNLVSYIFNKIDN